MRVAFLGEGGNPSFHLFGCTTLA